MRNAIELFEQDFARWGLHLPEGDATARRSGAMQQAGWHVRYDFGRDSRGEFLDYYAALRDGTDPSVTDDWHIRLYDTGDRVPLPTVLEAYMYARDPTDQELARARRHHAESVTPQVPPAAAVTRSGAMPGANPGAVAAETRVAPPKPATPTPPPTIRAPQTAPRDLGPPPSPPTPAPLPGTTRIVAPRTPGAAPGPVPGTAPGAAPGAAPRTASIAASSPAQAAASRPPAARSAGPARGPSVVLPSGDHPDGPTGSAQDVPSSVMTDIALEVGLDVALAGIAPVPGGDRLATWMLTPASVPALTLASGTASPKPATSPAVVAPNAAAPRHPAPPGVTAPPAVEVDALEVDAVEVDAVEVHAIEADDVAVTATHAVVTTPTTATTATTATTPRLAHTEAPAAAIDEPTSADLVFVADPPMSGAIDSAGILDTITITVGDEDRTFDEAPSAIVAQQRPDDDAFISFDAEDPELSRAVRRVSAPVVVSPLESDPSRPLHDGDTVEPTHAPPKRRSRTPDGTLNTTDMAAVAGSFEPWWYRPGARRIAMIAAVVVALIVVGSAVARHRSPPGATTGDEHASAGAPIGAAHAGAEASPAEPTDQSDGTSGADSTASGSDAAPDTLPVASTPPSGSRDPGVQVPAEGMARPAGPQSVPPIQRSGTPHAPLGPGKAPDKTGLVSP